jgi:hypothetical protein
MAKQGIDLADVYEPYVEHGKVFLRKRHDHLSPAHRRYDDCVRRAMKGRRYADAQAVRTAFRESAQDCARSDPY